MNNEQEKGARNLGERRGDGGGDGGEGDQVRSPPPTDSEKRPTPISDPPGLPSGIHQLSGGTGSASGIRKLPDWFAENSEDMEQQYWKGFKKRCDRIFTELQKSDGQLVRDIFRFEDPREYEDFLKCLQRDGHYQRGLLQVCREDTHIHVVHDCSYSNGSCRCSWFQKAKTYGANSRRDRRSHRRDSCRSRTPTDIQNLLLYYCSKGRSTVYQKIRGQLERIPSEGYNLQTSRLDGLFEIFREMEIQIPRTGAELQQWQPIISDDEPDQRIPDATPRRKKRKLGAQERIQIRVVELLQQYPICPPEALVKHKVWRDDPDLRFKDLTHREIKSAVSSYKDSLTTWSIEDYNEMYKKETCDPVFSAGYGNFENYYYNVENSVNIMIKLIEYQFDNDEEAILDFVHCVFNVLERKIPKLNCVVVHSPPSAGKNFFFDAIKSYYINCGHLCNANKYNNFPFQDAEGRRLVFWNEPNYSSEFLEPIKEILGGDSTSVNVKYQHDTPVYRTPVIVTTNNIVSFMHHPAFQDRLRIFEWQSAPYLKDYDKKPNPLAVYDFFKYFGLVK